MQTKDEIKRSEICENNCGQVKTKVRTNLQVLTKCCPQNTRLHKYIFICVTGIYLTYILLELFYDPIANTFKHH